MKVTFVAKAANRSGGFRVITTLAHQLRMLGHDTRIVHLPERRLPLARRVRDYLKGRRKSSASYLDDFDVPHTMLDAHRPVVDDDIPDGDVVVATWWETAYWVAGLSPRKGIKTYFVQGHEATIPGQPADAVTATLKLPLHKIVVAKWLIPIVQCGDPGMPVSLVPNSVDTELFFADQRLKQATATFGFMYSHAAIKGTDLAVAALQKARAEDQSIRALCFGLAKPSAPVLLPSWCTFHQNPSKEAMRSLYSSVDAWIVASRIEGFGLPILEAMACRTPVIATRAGAAPELVDSTTGRLVANEDVDGLRDAVLEFKAMVPANWSSMSLAAYERARSYTWRDAALRMVEAFEEARHAANTRHV